MHTDGLGNSFTVLYISCNLLTALSVSHKSLSLIPFIAVDHFGACYEYYGLDSPPEDGRNIHIYTPLYPFMI